MNIEIADYDVFFILSKLDEDTVQQIKQLAKQVIGFDVDVSSSFLEFDYSGRDTGRKIVTFLCQAASLIGSAEGEAECQITTDTSETHLEFYTIQNGRLYKQEAEIVRSPPVEVCRESAPELLAAAAG